MKPDPTHSPPPPSDDEAADEWGEVASQPETQPEEQWDQEAAVENDWGDVAEEKSKLPAKRKVQPQSDVHHIAGESIEDIKDAEVADVAERPITQLKVREIKGKGTRMRLDDAEKSDVERVPKKEVSQDSIKLAPRETEDKEWGKSQGISLKWMMLSGSVVIALVVVALVLLPSLKDSNAVVSDAEIRKKAEKEYIEERKSVIEDLLLRKYDAEQIYLDYASAPIVDELLPLLRDSKRVEPMVRDQHKGPTVSKTWDPGENFNYRVVTSGIKPFGLLKGSLQNFDEFTAYFVLEDDHLFLDWEATTGQGSASFSMLRKGLGDASKIRGTISPAVFYSESYPEEKYQSFQLISPNDEDIIWCYVERKSPAEAVFGKLFYGGDIIRKEIQPHRVTIRLDKGVEGAAPNQWMIAGLWHVDWVSP